MAARERVGKKSGRGGFSLLELLAVVSIIGILAAIGVPVLIGTRTKAVRKEAMSNIMRIASELEKWYADGNFSYQPGGTSCSDGASITVDESDGVIGGSLQMAIQGAYYEYIITVQDDDSNGLCESYAITANGIVSPATNQTDLTLDSTGVKTGPWN